VGRVEEVYREWIKTYNGGIKKIRKIMKGNGGRIPDEGKNTGKNTKNWKKVKTGKNYEEYLKGTENGEKKKNC
jgi:hypothetical protein